ncbi:hypothetical protein HanXRQr2_Chr15g0706661 [Helianthus annuus]|uniref:Uncharacterized protein n=1 Tax=Helianthus annuus TaxID=4232 RepID=A0A251S9W3_HELAN|nr:hypothetical protein HanXRQr2_Chr15g0706661 [Helianthus annuus]KAJ0456974.1 hypothetical protein HanIR_Chr15g0768551 [Helianthus annuus]KAJ0832390.1 hypothetical protein HanPSC8_Chr15g0678261 [Helianthus annuus]
MMEIDYMLSYGAAESSLRLLHIFHILKILLPIQKLFSHMDEFVSCDQPSTCYGLDFCAQGKHQVVQDETVRDEQLGIYFERACSKHNVRSTINFIFLHFAICVSKALTIL